MKSEPEESAKRTIENSPAIYRWDGKFSFPRLQVREADGRTSRADLFLSPVSRALEFIFGRVPSSKLLGYCRASAART